MLEPLDECIYEINDILSFLSKDKNKWVGLTNRLTKLLTQAWSEEQKEAIRDAIRFFAAGESGNITKEEMAVVIQGLQDKLGARMAEVFRKDVQKIQLESYTKGHTDAGIQFEFNTVDKKALHWLFEKDVKQFWIGESYTELLNETLNKAAAEVMKAGLGRDEAGKLFQSTLGTEFEKTSSYWELLSNHVVTRAREFGRTSSYEKAGIEYIKIVAVMDARTSSICRHLNGRIIPVSRAIEQRDNLLKATSVDEVKQIAPWYTPKEVDQKIKEVSTKDLPAGVGLPPYHGNCRSTTVIAYDYEIDTDISTMEIPGGNLKLAKEIAAKLQVKLDNKEQLRTKEIVKLKELCMNSGWGEDSLKYHFNKHRFDETIKSSSITDYNQKANDLIRDPFSDIYLTYSRKYGLQIWLHHVIDEEKELSNLLIITPGKEQIETFHQMREVFKLYIVKKTDKFKLQEKAKGIKKWFRKFLK